MIETAVLIVLIVVAALLIAKSDSVSSATHERERD